MTRIVIKYPYLAVEKPRLANQRYLTALMNNNGMHPDKSPLVEKHCKKFSNMSGSVVVEWELQEDVTRMVIETTMTEQDVMEYLRFKVGDPDQWDDVYEKNADGEYTYYIQSRQ